LAQTWHLRGWLFGKAGKQRMTGSGMKKRSVFYVARLCVSARASLFIILSLIFSSPVFLAPAAQAQEAGPQWQHALSLFGELKYPASFAHFDYVNANAPKGGELSLGATGTFDSLNPFIIKGTPAVDIPLIYDTLMISSLDEPFAQYGLLAEAVRHPPDNAWVTFRLRPEARFHDGKPVTPEDVIFSFNMLKKHYPQYAFYYANVVKAEKTGPRDVTFRFDKAGNRELPLIMGQLYVFPRHYWQGKDAQRKQRNFGETTLEPPLGSGPYRIAQVSVGRFIIYERVSDYWARNLNVNRGANNFARIRYEYYRDSTVALEAFRAGRTNFRLENSAKNWATGYNFPAVTSGKVTRKIIKLKLPKPMQALVFNLRRDKFKNRHVRRAFNYAFDFEWLNRNIFYGQYERLDSYFGDSELAASSIPQGDELAQLEPYRKQLPSAVFTRAYRNPVTDGSGQNRANLRVAQRLLEISGWVVKDGVLTHVKTGEKMSVEFLIIDPVSERILSPYAQALAQLGIQAGIRLVDTAQYTNRLRDFDFDITTDVVAQSLSPGNEQREYWGCEAAKRPGSQNLGGICDPVVEALIDKIIFADNREKLVTATHALDRVLLRNYYVVPEFTSPYRLAYEKSLKHPDQLPPYSLGFSTLWWYEPEK
jgi:microcin C transport system substrate-binding protein